NLSKSEAEAVKSSLSELLLKPDSTVLISQCFPQLILELLLLQEEVGSDKDKHHELMCVALGKLVNFHPEAFRQHWNWSDFMELYVGHDDPHTCWLACQCVALVTGMTDAQRQVLVNEHLSPEVIRSCATRFDSYGRELLIAEQVSSELKTAEDEYACHVSPLVVSICGIQLPVLDPESQNQNGCLVQVNSTLQNLKSLALAVTSGKAVCLQGPVGSGKTSLVEHLAFLTGRTTPHFHKVQLGDQTDSKMLLGTYRCTDIPGEFIWQPGVLTQVIFH
ncbi:Midasin, partial [Blattella germanica]